MTKVITEATIDKLAKHIEACTGYDVKTFARIECGEYTEENNGLIHTLVNPITVQCYGKEVMVTALDGDFAILKAIPHRGFDVDQIIWAERCTQAQLFTKVTIAVDRILMCR